MFRLFGFRVLGNRGEDGEKFVSFFAEVAESFGFDDFRCGQQLQPVGRFFQFAQTVAELRDEFRFRASAISLAIVRPDRRS